jgi:hypothetical protein
MGLFGGVNIRPIRVWLVVPVSSAVPRRSCVVKTLTDQVLYFCTGLLGWDAEEEKLRDFQKHADAAGIEMDIQYVDYGAEHPNTYKMTLWNEEGESREVTALSTGGGMIEVRAAVRSSWYPHVWHVTAVRVSNFCVCMERVRLHGKFKFASHTHMLMFA